MIIIYHNNHNNIKHNNLFLVYQVTRFIPPVISWIFLDPAPTVIQPGCEVVGGQNHCSASGCWTTLFLGRILEVNMITNTITTQPPHIHLYAPHKLTYTTSHISHTPHLHCLSYVFCLASLSVLCCPLVLH